VVCVPYRAARARQVALVSPKEDALVDVTEQPTDGADRIMRNKITNNVVFVRTIAAGAKVEVPFRCGRCVAPQHGALANDAGSLPCFMHRALHCNVQNTVQHLRTAERATFAAATQCRGPATRKYKLSRAEQPAVDHGQRCTASSRRPRLVSEPVHAMSAHRCRDPPKSTGSPARLSESGAATVAY
jgi:hypothetical protein